MRCYTIIFFIFYCLSVFPSHGAIDSVIIRFVSWDMGNGPHITSCVNFEYDVPYKEYIINDPNAIQEVIESMKGITPVKKRDFSVGCKLLLVKGDSVVKKVAMNRNFMLLNGKTYSCPTNVIKIIDNLMSANCESQKSFHYLPDWLGNEYKDGRDALYHKLSKHLDKQKKHLEIKGNTRIVVYCRASQRGKTTKILRLNVYNENLTEKDIEIVEKDLYVFFKKIKWKKIIQEWIVTLSRLCLSILVLLIND